MLLDKAGDFSRLVEVGMLYYCKNMTKIRSMTANAIAKLMFLVTT